MVLKVRPARPRDAALIVRLMQSGFDRARSGTLIYGCAGAAVYVRNQLSLPKDLCDTIYVVCEQGRSLVGVAELRLTEDTLFLNYIAIASSQQGRGIGRNLLHQALVIAKKDNQRIINLDVFEDNERARVWYERLGFQKEYSSLWMDVSLADVKATASGTITGYGQAQECQQFLGFSQFILTTTKGTYTIGRLGRTWFRTTQRDILTDTHALACLKMVDKKRRLLAIIRDNTGDRRPVRARTICRSLRMSMDLAVLMRRLSDTERKA